MRRFFERIWYERHPFAASLIPAGWLFRGLVALRRLCYRTERCRVERLEVPVIVVGNITVGGSGKTPLVAWIVERLGAAGYRPGIVSRGYGGEAHHWPQRVTADSDPAQVGDEAVLLARRTGCPIAVAPDRVAAARLLTQTAGVDVIVSDDGLQHYRLGRDIEIAVIDGQRRLGNGRCLPAGPLREPPARVAEVDFVVANGTAEAGEVPMQLVPDVPHAVRGAKRRADWADFRGRRAHAVAGIGYPERFFAMLRRGGIETVEHAFADHHPFRAQDLAFGDGLPVLMTEKDAVKCSAFAAEQHWYVPVRAELPASFETALLERLVRSTDA